MMTAAMDLHGIDLPSRYEIRKVTREHEEWYRALLLQGLLLRAPVWWPMLPEPKVKTALGSFKILEPYYRYPLQTGLSFAIYDKEYEFKRPESAASGGALYWHEIDLEDPQLEEKGLQWMLEKMDFPVIALASSYDMFASPTQESFAAMATVAPLWGKVVHRYFDGTVSVPGLPVPTAFGQYIHRSGCVTRSDYEGRKIAKLFTWWVMLEMKARGYCGIMVGAGNVSISRIYQHPDAPFKSKAVLEEDMANLEIEMPYGKVRPYIGDKPMIFKYFLCDLNQKQA